MVEHRVVDVQKTEPSVARFFEITQHNLRKEAIL